MNDTVSYTSADGIATVTINRAEKMNALNEEVIQGLRSAWLRFADSSDRVAILHAAGDRAFSVGADIKSPPSEMWQGVPSVGVRLDKPVIAAVHGWCIGGAYVIVQMCDLVVAADNTVFKYPEAQLGFTGGLIASAVARIPHKIAMEFMLLGQDLSAERAFEVGMVNKVVPKGTELEAALGFAEILAKSAPLVVETLKKFSLATLNQSPAEAGALAREGLLRIRTSEDGAEGGRAFREKRDPIFTGR
ncbi:MAG: enoyl-CoA hydratase-related protein [Gammaproteobacteria bacterium]|nr:enoyl-CoA hydratase-related protein [Gammaproteobacteria bacterium]